MIDIDLHLHTHYSDGTESPEELVKRAYREGLRTIAVTDHDGIDGIPDALRTAASLHMRMIPGLEFSTEWYTELYADEPEKYTMHVLGYGIDPESEPLQIKMQEIRKRRTERNEKLYRAFREKGIELKPEELEADSPGRFVGKRSFATTFVKRGLANSIEEAFDSVQLLNDPTVRLIRKEKTSADEAVKMIHQAGGKAFLAHPFQLGYPSLALNPEGFRQHLVLIIRKLRDFGLDGLECYYPTHDQEQTDFLLSLADENNLLVSIGSDDHGPHARKIKKIHSFQTEADPERLRWIDTL